jgi:hypothetical protein
MQALGGVVITPVLARSASRVIAVMSHSLAARGKNQLPGSAMAARMSAPCSRSKAVAGLFSEAEAMELENVVRRADQRPFALDRLQSVQEELSEAPGLFDLLNYRFDDRLARRIDGFGGFVWSLRDIRSTIVAPCGSNPRGLPRKASTSTLGDRADLTER